MTKTLMVLLLLSNILFAKVNIVVSIIPEQTFVNEIGGDKVNISLMVKPGNEPHTYEPKPSQMKDISKADIYFSIDVEFEHTWLKRFSNQNKKMNIIDLSKGITKIKIPKNNYHQDEQHINEHKEDNLDPHIWTSPSNVRLIAKNILLALINIDIKNKDYYTNNYKKFIKKINNTNKEINLILSNTKKDTKFMVFHPSWGYFAKDYNLIQFAIQSEGKNPKPKQIIHLINKAKNNNIKAIFTAPQFSQKAATQIAKAVGVPVIKTSTLDAKWSKNLIKLAKAIANK